MLGLFGAIGRLLPGYVQGEHMAIQDNWTDLNQYNQVQQGQLANAFTEATFNDAYNMFLDRAGMSRLIAQNMGLDYAKRAMNYPMEAATAVTQASWLPSLAQAQAAAQMQLYANPYGTQESLLQQLLPLLQAQQPQQPALPPEEAWRRGQQQQPVQTPTVAR